MVQLAENANSSVKEIKKYFSWFDDNFSNIIKDTAGAFWKTDVEVKLFSLEKNSKNFFSGNDYFVAQAQTQNIIYSSRLSETACEIFLVSALGNNEDRFFEISHITELEANIINKFNKQIFTKIKEFFLSKKEINRILDNEGDFNDCLHLGFVIKSDNDDFEIGKMFLSIPEKLLKYPDIEPKEGEIDTTRFKKAKTPVDIFIGTTKLSLDDINNIEADDIVVLEKSNIKKMKVVEPTVFEFNVNPDPRLFIKDDEENNGIQEDTGVNTKDIWDNVQVDVSAKFPKVKMSLGELREMTEGVVMELDSVYDNEVVLEVENKKVAKGELVIVGYKYGVKITEILAQTDDEEEANNDVVEKNEDFDVQDFEIEG